MFARLLVLAATLLLFLSAATPVSASYAQAGSKLTAADAAGASVEQGFVLALSTDGNTAVVGGHYDNSSAGATWVYTRSGNTWSQQGAKLVGSGGVPVYQGSSVAVSADGNTMAEGSSSAAGAAWVFTRTAGVWSQQGSSLLGSGAVGSANQGQSISLSADGNTMLLGGWRDNNNVGAAWVFTRSLGVWSQQGLKLVGSGGVGTPLYQGVSVALSADGNTALVGGTGDNSVVGATWVFTRTGSVWSQQAKLVGTGAAGVSRQGISVALSADGNTAVVGGNQDNGNAGAMWVFTRGGSVWSQQAKLVGTGAVGLAIQGTSVAITSDGNTAVSGGTFDNNSVGATWVFTRSGGVWSQLGGKLAGTGVVNIARQGQSVALSGDGKTVLVGGYLDNSGIGAVWTFVEASPKIVTVHDVPNDQGGKVSVRWNASLLDIAPFSPIDSYWIWRQVPIHAAIAALAHGATLLREGDRGTPVGRVFRTTTSAAEVYYWEFVASQVAHGFPAYSYTASTLADSVPGSNPYTLFMVEAERASTGEYWSSQPDSGYSVDNLPPGPPAPVAAAYSGGATHLHWGANVETDFAMYRVYRGGSVGFVPGLGNRIAAQPDTGFADVGAAGSYYKISAVDAHGNESVFALVSPTATTDVSDGGTLGFALEGARPNPARGTGLNVAFALPTGGRAVLELIDTSGRRVVSREVGSLGAGRHTVNLAEARTVAPGVYWVRLTQGTNQRGARVAVIE